MTDSYHHGDLRAELLRRAVEVIDRDGAADLSLRALAREAGVSHAAPRHHFTSRAGLITALAAEGFRLLAERLTDAGAGGVFVEVGVAYVQFAADFPAHFDVMFRPDLYDADAADLVAAQQEAFDVLRAGVDAMSVPDAMSVQDAGSVPDAGSGRDAGSDAAVGDAAAAVVAGWSLVHGLATLAATGNLDSAHLRDLLPEPDLPAITRRIAGMLYGSPRRRPR